jgi:hypothetical protein
MAQKKFVGLGYLHQHSVMERQLGVDADHVIVDKKDWEEVCQYFECHPEATADILPITAEVDEPVFTRSKYPT